MKNRIRPAPGPGSRYLSWGDELYFSLPYDKMDLCLYGKNNGYSSADIADVLELTPEQVQRVYDDIDTKRSTTRYLHLTPQLIEEVPEIKG